MTPQQIREKLRGGGSWLGAARNWMQWHKSNGSRVEWGSQEVLEPPMTVKDAENLAFDVAAVLSQELENMKLQNEDLRNRIYQLGLMCDRVPGLSDGYCPDVGQPRDNLTRICLALKWLMRDTNDLTTEDK